MSEFGIMNTLRVFVCDTPQEAEAQGHIYRWPIKAVEIEKVVVVNKGTEEGNSTVDLVLKDEQGNQYVVMVTGKLLKNIPC